METGRQQSDRTLAGGQVEGLAAALRLELQGRLHAAAVRERPRSLPAMILPCPPRAPCSTVFTVCTMFCRVIVSTMFHHVTRVHRVDRVHRSHHVSPCTRVFHRVHNDHRASLYAPCFTVLHRVASCCTACTASMADSIEIVFCAGRSGTRTRAGWPRLTSSGGRATLASSQVCTCQLPFA